MSGSAEGKERGADSPSENRVGVIHQEFSISRKAVGKPVDILRGIT